MPIEAPVNLMKFIVPAAKGTKSFGTELIALRFKDGITNPRPIRPRAIKKAIIQKVVSMPVPPSNQQETANIANPIVNV